LDHRIGMGNTVPTRSWSPTLMDVTSWRGGGGVAYPDRYYFNLRGRALEMIDGPHPGNSNSPTDETRRIEKMILSSFSAVAR
jgi:hypothetical protein